jgi:hypothetical protein
MLKAGLKRKLAQTSTANLTSAARVKLDTSASKSTRMAMLDNLEMHVQRHPALAKPCLILLDPDACPF